MEPEEKTSPGYSLQKTVERSLEAQGWRFSKFERPTGGGFNLIGKDGAGQPAVVLVSAGLETTGLKALEAAIAARRYYHQGRGRAIVLFSGTLSDHLVRVADQSGVELWDADLQPVQTGLDKNPRPPAATLGKTDGALNPEQASWCPSCGKLNRLDWTRNGSCAGCGQPLPFARSSLSPHPPTFSPPPGEETRPQELYQTPPLSSRPPRWLAGLVVVGVLGVIINLVHLSSTGQLSPGQQPASPPARGAVRQPSPPPGGTATPYSATPSRQIPALLRPFPEVITGHLVNNQVMFPAELIGPTGKTASVEVMVDSGNANLDGVYEPIAEAAGLIQTGTRLLLGIQGPATVQPQYGGFLLIPQGQFVAGRAGSPLQVPEAIGLPQIVGGSTVNLGQDTLGHEAQFVEINGQWWFGWYPSAQSPTTPPPAPPDTRKTLPGNWKAWTYASSGYTVSFALPPTWTQVPSAPSMWQGPENSDVSFNLVSAAERVPILRPGIWGPQSTQNIPYIANGYDTRIFYQQLGADTYAMVEIVVPVQEQDLALAIAETMRFVPNAP
jgi:hypothetical protein